MPDEERQAVEGSLDGIDHGVDHDHDEACMPTGRSKNSIGYVYAHREEQ